jgi:CRP/FNR family cyclic AMP-dependent transcriptional regulator
MIEPGSLIHVEIFEGLSSEHLQRISAIGHEQTFAQGDIIFRENAHGDSMYIVLSGEVEIQVDPRILGDEADHGSGATTITTIRLGQSFGEVALVDQGVRSASAICNSEQVQLLVIPRDDFLRICREDPALGYSVMFNIAADLAARIRTTDFMLRGRLLLAHRK